MPKGGARPGAGRKKKPLGQKLADGNPGHRPITKLDIDGSPARPQPPDFLRVTVKSVNRYPSAVDFFEQIVDWLDSIGCLKAVPHFLIENYALAKFFLTEAAFALSTTALVSVSKQTKEMSVTSFAKSFFECAKTANDMWDKIWMIVRDSCETVVKSPEQDFIAKVSSMRQRKARKEAPDERPDDDENPGGEAEPGEI